MAVADEAPMKNAPTKGGWESGKARVRRASRPPRRSSPGKGPDRHEILKRMLEERDHAVRRKLHDVREGPGGEETGPTDAGDRIQSDLIREIDVSLLEKEAEARTTIGNALRRVERAADEVCSRCGGPIGRARLRAVPFTDVCTACKEKEESARAEAGRRNLR
jgi:RNA polymerase-binding transcription factor DksA